MPVFIQDFILPNGSQVTGLQVNPSNLYIYSGTYDVVIATADGFKDYKEVELKLKPNRIVNFTPNPAGRQVTVNYKINEGSNAYLMLVNISGNNNAVGNYVIDVNADSKTINLSSYPTGVYSISLVVDGQITDVQELLMNNCNLLDIFLSEGTSAFAFLN